MLITLGFRRDEVARWTGYSPSHISRICHMPEAEREAEEFGKRLVLHFTDEVTARITMH
jgi:hypothetical protein